MYPKGLSMVIHSSIEPSSDESGESTRDLGDLYILTISFLSRTDVLISSFTSHPLFRQTGVYNHQSSYSKVTWIMNSLPHRYPAKKRVSPIHRKCSVPKSRSAIRPMVWVKNEIERLLFCWTEQRSIFIFFPKHTRLPIRLLHWWMTYL